MDLDTAEISRALDEIGTYDPEMSDTLRALTDEYQYGRLLRMIENNADAKEAA